MSVATEIERIQTAKETLKTKLNAKNDSEHQITNELISDYHYIRRLYTMTPDEFSYSSSVFCDKIYVSSLSSKEPIMPMIAIKGNEYVSQGTGRYDDPYLILGGK